MEQTAPQISSRPFTKVVLTECPKCKGPLKPLQLKCSRCGHFLLRITMQPKQRRILDLVLMTGPGIATKIGFGGSRGAAKSRLARDLALTVAFSIPNIVVFIIRRNWGDLEENHVEKLKLERPELTRYYSGQRQAYEFPQELGNSRIAFKYGDTMKDIIQVGRGPECYLEIVDQAEQFSEDELAELNTPNRWPGSAENAAKTVYLFNPGGVGTQYLRRVFFLKQYKENERPSAFTFIQAYGWDNYEWFRSECSEYSFEQFYSLPGNDIPPCPMGVYDNKWLDTVPANNRFKLFVTRTTEGRKMWEKPPSIRMGDLFGRFDAFAGQYFAGVWEEHLCVLPSSLVDQIVKPWWVCWMGGDRGFGHHTAIYWACIGKLSPSEAWSYLNIDTDWPLDVVIIYRELVASRMAEEDLGREVVKMTPRPERAELRKWVLGSDAQMTPRFAKHSIKEMIESVTEPAGMPTITKAQDGPGSRVVNARILYEMLRRTTVMRGDNPPKEKPDPKTVPCLFISAECPQLISSFPLLMSDALEGNPDDVKKEETMQDDCYDGAKYTCAEYLGIRESPPREIRLREAMDRADSNTQKHINMLKFNHEEKQGQRRTRRR